MNKRKLFLIVIVVVGLTLASLSAAYAIVFGWPDGDDHPYVGMMVADDADGPAWRCSGTLISPTVFLTAGHCAFEAEGGPGVVRHRPDGQRRVSVGWRNLGRGHGRTPTPTLTAR